MNKSQALSVLDSLKEGWYSPPIYYFMKKERFLFKSYARSAIDEIRFYLIKNKTKDPIEIIEKFRTMVDNLSCQSKGDKGFMFSVYYDVVTDVLDILLSMK